MELPSDFDSVVNQAWEQASAVPGFLAQLEFRALALLAYCAPRGGVIVEIGSFKGKSTLALASVARRYGLGPVVSIDPHTAPSITDPNLDGKASSFDDFLTTIRSANLEEQVEVHRAISREVAAGWNRRIRMLWIDGDHTYKGTKEDFDLFSPHLAEGATIALHDTLGKNFDGPIRVFVEDILRSDNFGPAGFSYSMGWSQYRPVDGWGFRGQRERLARKAARLMPFVSTGRRMQGIPKLQYKVLRSLIPHSKLPIAEALKSPKA
jgi:MMP 1-O-methyltransferase